MIRSLMAVVVALIAGGAPAEEIRVAVASNFRYAMDELAPRFERDTGHELTLIFGSTGKLFAQIENGAPFDVFLAGDELRPRMLEEDGLALPGSRFVYAIGKLVLWSAGATDEVNERRLVDQDFRFLSIANPLLAPYGRAARQALVKLGVWEQAFPRIVRGENVAQAYQYVVTGNADLGLVALAQIRLPSGASSGAFWAVPVTYYDPIRQQAAVLSDDAAAADLAAFLRSAEARAVIESFGYEVP